MGPYEALAVVVMELGAISWPLGMLGLIVAMLCIGSAELPDMTDEGWGGPGIMLAGDRERGCGFPGSKEVWELPEPYEGSSGCKLTSLTLIQIMPPPPPLEKKNNNRWQLQLENKQTKHWLQFSIAALRFENYILSSVPEAAIESRK